MAANNNNNNDVHILHAGNVAITGIEYPRSSFNYVSPVYNMSAAGGSLGNSTMNGTLNGTTLFKSAVSLNYDLPTMIAVAAILFVVTIATAFGNFLVGLALFKFKNLRTVSNHLIGNLALSDFLLSCTILPFSTVQECLGYWVFGKIMCNFWLCIDVLYCTASIWNLCIIGLDRYTATVYPLWYREKRSNSQAAIYIAIVWVTAFAIAVPPLLGWNDLSKNYVYEKETNVYQCVLFQTQSYVLFSASGSFFVPFLITVIFYIRIFMVLRVRMVSMRRQKKKKQRTLNALSAKSTSPNITTATKVAKIKSKEHELNNLTLPDTTAEIELSQVCIPSVDGPSGVEDSSKSMFSTDSCDDDDEDDDDSCTQLRTGCNKPLCATNTTIAGSKDAQTYTTRVIKNGLKEKGTKSETLVILNPAHDHLYSSDDKDSDAENVQLNGPRNISSNNDKQGGKLVKLKKTKVKVQVTEGGNKVKRPMGVTLKKVTTNPFKKNKAKNGGGFNTTSRARVDQREIRATIRMSIIIAVFCTCWFGFFTTYVIHSWCTSCKIPREVDAFFFWLGYSNSSMNPILYAIFNEDFRRAFAKLLGCYRRQRPGASMTRTYMK